jgi:ELWxxDGT repeat protein
VSDGTDAGTFMLKDIWAGATTSTPTGFIGWGGRTFFSAVDDAHGRELWKTDGTPAGTVLVTDLDPGPNSSMSPGTFGFAPPIGPLIFAAASCDSGLELWTTDGTVSGTHPLTQINPGPASALKGMSGDSFFIIRGLLVFGADNGLTGYELWALPLSAPGAVPDGNLVSGIPLTLTQTAGEDISLTWGSSCILYDSDYAIYEGALGSFDSHIPLACSTGGATTATITPSSGDRYYLVVPRNVLNEGSYGEDSQGFQRPASTAPCSPQALSTCP